MANDSNAQFLAVLNRLALVGERLVAAMEAGKGGAGGSGGGGGGVGGSIAKSHSKAEDSPKGSPFDIRGVASSVVSAGANVLPSMSSLEGSREFTGAVTGPVEGGYREVAQFSQKGIILQEAELDKIATQVASQQLAAQTNMKNLRTRVDEGVVGNIVAKVGEEYVNANKFLTEGGKHPVPELPTFNAEEKTRQALGGNYSGVGAASGKFWQADAFGR